MNRSLRISIALASALPCASAIASCAWAFTALLTCGILFLGLVLTSFGWYSDSTGSYQSDLANQDPGLLVLISFVAFSISGMVMWMMGSVVLLDKPTLQKYAKFFVSLRTLLFASLLGIGVAACVVFLIVLVRIVFLHV